jgi:hypothetical protein
MRAANRAGETAGTLILVGLILDIILEVVLLFVGALLLIVPVIGGIFLVFAIIGFVWIALIWVYSYARVKDGDYEGARTPTLVFAILSLLTLAIVPGILFLIAYVKLGDALESGALPSQAWGPTPTAPIPAAPVAAAPRYCARCGRASPGSAVFCEGCGAPLG